MQVGVNAPGREKINTRLFSNISSDVTSVHGFSPSIKQMSSFSNSFAIAVDSTSKITAFSRDETKTNKWTTDKFFLRKISAPVIWKNAIWFVDQQGYLHGLSTKNGEVISRFRLKDGLLSGMIKTTPNGILLQTAKGQLIMLKKN